VIANFLENIEAKEYVNFIALLTVLGMRIKKLDMIKFAKLVKNHIKQDITEKIVNTALNPVFKEANVKFVKILLLEEYISNPKKKCFAPKNAPIFSIKL